MVSFEEAYNIVIAAAKLLPAETVKLNDALHRALAADAFSDMDMPPFNRSAMDGYACRRENLSNELQVIERVAAGEIPQHAIQANQCTKIMTGAIVPEGADVVIIVEQTEITGENKIRFTGTGTSDNISRKAEDIKKEQLVLQKGSMLKPQHIALLASIGYHQPEVYKQPRVGIISTGDEIVESSEIPSPSQIRNSNAHQLFAQVKRANAIPTCYGIAKDDPKATETMIIRALSLSDIVLLTGGVSMGDYDFVPEILKKNRINLLFEKINVKPGRPTLFGTFKNKYVFGLPGNPVACYMMFEMLVKPLIYEMMGHHYIAPPIYMHLEQAFKGNLTDRAIIVPVKFTPQGGLTLVEYHGSAHVHSLCQADGVFVVPLGVKEIKKGEMVHVRQL